MVPYYHDHVLFRFSEILPVSLTFSTPTRLHAITGTMLHAECPTRVMNIAAAIMLAATLHAQLPVWFGVHVRRGWFAANSRGIEQQLRTLISLD
jgi:hypothetical protein